MQKYTEYKHLKYYAKTPVNVIVYNNTVTQECIPVGCVPPAH